MALGRLTIDLDAVAANWRLLAERAGPSECAAVVKADAYGLGAGPVAKRLAEAGCRHFFVATAEEGTTLRGLLPNALISVLAPALPQEVAEMVASRLRPVLNHPGDLEAWRRHGNSQPAWLHVDTGMLRLGYTPKEWDWLIASRPNWLPIQIVGIMSHYACADEPEHPLNARQRDAGWTAARMAKLPLSLGNSSGIFLGRAFQGHLVRPGMALYGLNPTPGRPNPMRRAVTLEACVLQVRRVDSMATVGYGASASAGPGHVLATVGLGYADGYLRSLSGAGRLYFRGQAAPVVGRVSMDSVVIDISDLAEQPTAGDWMEIIGPNQSADAIADAAGTIGYEILTSLGHRYARTYVRPGSGA